MKNKPSKADKFVNTSFLAPSETRKWLEAEAVKQERSVSALIRVAINAMRDKIEEAA